MNPIAYGVLNGKGFLQTMPRDTPEGARDAAKRATPGSRAIAIVPLEHVPDDHPMTERPTRPLNRIADAIRELVNAANQTQGLPTECMAEIYELLEGL